MASEFVPSSTPPAPQQGQAPQGTGEGRQTQEGQQPAPAQQDRPGGAPNLYEMEEFRRVQTSWQNKIEAERQAATRAMQERDMLRQRMEELEEGGLDDVERLQLQKQRLERQYGELQTRERARVEQEQAQQAKMQDLRDIASIHGVPVESLYQASTFWQAVEMAVKERDRMAEEKRKQRDEDRVANRVDTGGGYASTPSTRIEADIRDAWDSGDARRYISLLRQARRQSAS